MGYKAIFYYAKAFIFLKKAEQVTISREVEIIFNEKQRGSSSKCSKEYH